MNWPIRSQNLSEFWGRRWNLAFHDLMHRFVFHPLCRQIGSTWSLMLCFFTSGLIHEIVISVPASGGYGCPTAYFLIQGAGVLTESSRWGRRLGINRGWRGRLHSALILICPCGLLFHPPFITNVVVPFLNAMRSTS
jgi:hypothetical protein